MGAAQAAAIICGCRQLVLGDEIGVTAYEVSTDGDRIRLAAADLQATARILGDNGVECSDFEAWSSSRTTLPPHRTGACMTR
ncbi:hypothetical protein [Rhodococcus koreensis]